MEKAIQLEAIYYGDSPGALRGPQALFEQAKKQGLATITRKDCLDYLLTQPTHTLYRRARRNYKRNKIDVHSPGEVVQIDIMDLVRFSQWNNGLRFVLLTYDSYSKYLTATVLESKGIDAVKTGLEKVINESPFEFRNIYWEKEGSFLSKRVQAWLKTLQIHNYTTKSQVKAPGVERSIRTLRMAIQRHFEATKTWRWLEFLPKFVTSYNNRKHSTTKLNPIDLANDPMLVAPHDHHLQPAKTKTKIPPTGSFVRLNRLRDVFEKEASGSWGREIFKVVGHKTGASIPMIKLSDLTGEVIEGAFYPEEVLQVPWDPEDKQVENVLKKRKRKTHPREQLVTYVGWPTKHTEWIPV